MQDYTRTKIRDSLIAVVKVSIESNDTLCFIAISLLTKLHTRKMLTRRLASKMTWLKRRILKYIDIDHNNNQ